MFRKINLWIIITLFTIFSILPLNDVSAQISENQNMKVNFNTKNELKEYVQKKQDINVMLYDENGKIINEYHSDSTVVEYHYDNEGRMIESDDTHGGKQKYEFDNGKIKVKLYQNEKLVKEKELGNEKQELKTKKKDLASISSLTQYENYYVKGVLMNQLLTDSEYINKESMTYNDIISFLQSKNSILQNTVLIYRLTSGGSVYFAGETIDPASQIRSSAVAWNINPKLILVQLQKESSLVTAPPGSVSYSSRRFYYAMGYGATDGGDIYGTSGFDTQISSGTKLMWDLYNSSLSSGYPIKLPDANISSINFGRTITDNGVTYKNYIWVKNRATYALYRYTPHVIDVTLYDQSGIIGGGNYLVYSIFKGWWTSWN